MSKIIHINFYADNGKMCGFWEGPEDSWFLKEWDRALRKHAKEYIEKNNDRI